MVQDYVLLARLKGMSNLRLVLQEALRNALAPTLALTGVQFTFLIGGTVIIERIFAYPGIGNMAVDAVINRDLPLNSRPGACIRRAVYNRQSDRRSPRGAVQSEIAAWVKRRRHCERSEAIHGSASAHLPIATLLVRGHGNRGLHD